MTNVERLTAIMETSKAGPMAQVLIMEAVFNYCKKVQENEKALLKQMEGGFIHGPAWIETAKIVLEELHETSEFYIPPDDFDPFERDTPHFDMG